LGKKRHIQGAEKVDPFSGPERRLGKMFLLNLRRVALSLKTQGADKKKTIRSIKTDTRKKWFGEKRG